jgi:hypothetical protein
MNARKYATGRQLHIDRPLSKISIGFVPTDFIADQIYPVVPVVERSDKYYIFDRGDWFRVPNTLRATKEKPKRVEFAVSSESYYANNYALAEEIAWEDRANADAALSLDMSTTEHLTGLLMTDWEKRLASQLTSTSNLGSSTTLSGTDQWSDFVNSDPVGDVTAGMQAIQGSTGKKANLAVMGQEVWNKLKDHPDILDRIKHTQRGIATPDIVAQVFQVDKLLIGAAIENTGTEGLADSMSYIWGKNVLLAHTPASAGLRTASLGYAFRWKPAGFGDMTVIRNRDEERRVDILSVEYFQDEKITASELGYLIADTIA